ncbi:hypothetical protein FI667_g6880, partial [Globisporangium splendens]
MGSTASPKPTHYVQFRTHYSILPLGHSVIAVPFPPARFLKARVRRVTGHPVTSGSTLWSVQPQSEKPSAMNADEETMMRVNPASTASSTTTRDDCPHLSDLEWSALQRLGKVVDEKAIFAILATCPPEQHRLTAIGFLQKEAKERGREATRAVTAQVQPPRQKAVKLDVAKYGGGDKEPLLRWFVEIDAAIRTGQMYDPEQQVDFAMSKLAGRAKSWAFGRRMAGHHCFRTLAEFKSDIRAAFLIPTCTGDVIV